MDPHRECTRKRSLSATGYRLLATAYQLFCVTHCRIPTAHWVRILRTASTICSFCHTKAIAVRWRAIRSDDVVAQDTVDVDTTAEGGIDARLTALETKIDVKLEPIRRDLAVIKHAVKEILLRLR